MYLLDLEEVLEFGENLIEFFVVFTRFIGNIFKSLYYALVYLVQITPKVALLITTLPSWLIPFASVTLAISISYFIIHREAGKR